VTEHRVLLAVYAHPDDEAVRAGGTLAMLACQGVRVHLVCATYGEAGRLGEPPVCAPEELGQLREQELRAACGALGIERPTVLGYPDGNLASVDWRLIVDYLVGAMTAWGVTTVLTFGPDGISGHPDHVAIGRLATEAFIRARHQAAATGQGAWHVRPERLYYQVVPRSVAKEFALQGVEGIPDELVTATVDVSGWLGAKIAALHYHGSQRQGMRFLDWPADRRDEFLCLEHFRCAFGPLEAQQPAFTISV